MSIFRLGRARGEEKVRLAVLEEFAKKKSLPRIQWRNSGRARSRPVVPARDRKIARQKMTSASLESCRHHLSIRLGISSVHTLSCPLLTSLVLSFKIKKQSSSSEDVSNSRRDVLKNALGISAAFAALGSAGGKARTTKASVVENVLLSIFGILGHGPRKKVDLYANGTIAIVEAVSPELGNRVQRVRVLMRAPPGNSAKVQRKEYDFIAVNLKIPEASF